MRENDGSRLDESATSSDGAEDDGAPEVGGEAVRRGEETRRRERLSTLAQQWAALRAERRPEPIMITTGTSNFNRAQVPWALDLAAAWSWRLIVIAAATFGLTWLLAYFAVITMPLAVSLLVAALLVPAVAWLEGVGLRRGFASMLVVVLALSTVGLLLSYVGQQIAQGARDLGDSVVAGLGQIADWLRDGPLNLTDNQLDRYVEATQRAITAGSRGESPVTQVTEVGTVVGHVLAGFFIVLFATYFFLADGERIWAWLVRLSPRAARERVDTSGRVAWVSLTQFVRATVLVALADAIGVVIVAAALGVPFVLALGVLVFLGAFVPMVGATVAGSVAVLVALVDQGPVTALLMLGGVILVQQIEGHVLQPFLMGRFVSLHPLGVIVAIGCGVLAGGIAGALIAVPLVAAGNAVVVHLARHVEPDDDDLPVVSDKEEDMIRERSPDLHLDPARSSPPARTPRSDPMSDTHE